MKAVITYLPFGCCLACQLCEHPILLSFQFSREPVYHALVVLLLHLHALSLLVQDLLPIFIEGVVQMVSYCCIVLHGSVLARISQESLGEGIPRQNVEPLVFRVHKRARPTQEVMGVVALEDRAIQKRRGVDGVVLR